MENETWKKAFGLASFLPTNLFVYDAVTDIVENLALPHKHISKVVDQLSGIEGKKKQCAFYSSPNGYSTDFNWFTMWLNSLMCSARYCRPF